MMLLPFYAVGRVVLGASSLIRSCLLGMIVYSGVNALLVRQLSFQISKRHRVANLAAFLFAFTTMAFSYSRLLYPQPLVTMFMLLTFYFLLKYTEDPVLPNLFGVALFYGLTVFSFNAFIITAPCFLYYLVNKTGVFRLLLNKTGLRTIGLEL
jgi:4-amino-4-deoxy-L-arabinose transferase-like glycosyltransferase